jgi:glutaminase
VRNIFLVERVICVREKKTTKLFLFVGSLVESEYINTLKVYFTYCIISQSEINLSKCCCIAENQKERVCKHRATLLFALSISKLILFFQF